MFNLHIYLFPIFSTLTCRLNIDWIWEHYPPEVRHASMIYMSENVLTPEVIQAMYRHKKAISSIKTKYNDTWEGYMENDVHTHGICRRIPIVKAPEIYQILNLGRRRRSPNEDNSFYEFGEEDYDAFSDNGDEHAARKSIMELGEELSVDYYPQPYCRIVKDMEKACLEFSILELWARDGKYGKDTDDAIENLTVEDIIHKINHRNMSGVFLVERNFTELLSGVQRDSNGQIISAKATITSWFGRMNTTEAKANPVNGREVPITKENFEFEDEMLKVLLNQTGHPKGLKSYPQVERSITDVSTDAIFNDVIVLGIGYDIMVVYVQLMLGRFNCVEQRILLSVAGVFSVIMGLVMSHGICSALGLIFTPLHQVLPFLLLGIGIDDMFIIVQCYDVLESKDKAKSDRQQNEDPLSLPERFGRAMS